MNDLEAYERLSVLHNCDSRNAILMGLTARGAQHSQRVRDVVPYINVAYGEDDWPRLYSPLRHFMGLIDPTTVSRITIKHFTVIMISDVETLHHKERNVTLVDEHQREWAAPPHKTHESKEDVLGHRLERLHDKLPEADKSFIYEYEKLTYFLDCLFDILEDEFGVVHEDGFLIEPRDNDGSKAWIEFYKSIIAEYEILMCKGIHSLRVLLPNVGSRTRHFI